MTLSLGFHGAAGTVTGSCNEMIGAKGRILIDCGLFQGSRSLEVLNFRPFPFAPSSIDAVILTHAHIDHCGLLPRLVAHGYEGPIFCTAATADLLEYMLADAGRIHETEARRRNRRADRGESTPIEPIYTEADAMAAWKRTKTIGLEELFEPAPGFQARLWNAGHVLGSASVEVQAERCRLLFSGDLGPDNKAFQRMPAASAGFDHVVCESTYGDRCRERLDPAGRRELLHVEVTRSLARGGNLIIPTFALERTQELLLDLAALLREHRLGNARVFVDSPLAIRLTSVFTRHADDLEDMDGGGLLDPSIHAIEDTDASIRLNSLSGAIILAASGMCEGGRIRHHLLHNLPRKESTVLFVGYQAQGTLGRVILDGASRVRISGREVSVRAEIRHIDGYSAHADQNELVAWITARAPISGSLFLNHGEQDGLASLSGLAARLVKEKVVVPEIGERYELRAATPARRTRTGLPNLRGIIGRDWQNDYAALAVNLKRRLQALPDADTRRAAIRRMRTILETQTEKSEHTS